MIFSSIFISSIFIAPQMGAILFANVFCLPVSHKKDARLIQVNGKAVNFGKCLMHL